MIALILSSLSLAARLAMEPQNKVHAGASMIGSSYGVALGLDSRLTQLIYIDIGGFISVSDTSDIIPVEDDLTTFALPRHALYATPGWRIPHRYKEDSLNWDIVLRAGFGAMFTKDLSAEDVTHTDPALITGADFLLRKGQYGGKFSFKEFYFTPYISEMREDQLIFQSQFALEFFVQF